MVSHIAWRPNYCTCKAVSCPASSPKSSALHHIYQCIRQRCRSVRRWNKAMACKSLHPALCPMAIKMTKTKATIRTWSKTELGDGMSELASCPLSPPGLPFAPMRALNPYTLYSMDTQVSLTDSTTHTKGIDRRRSQQHKKTGPRQVQNS